MDMPGSWQYDYGANLTSTTLDAAQPEALLNEVNPLRRMNATVILRNSGDPTCSPVIRLKIRDEKGKETPVNDYAPERTATRYLFRNIPLDGGADYLLYAARKSETVCTFISQTLLNSDVEIEETEDAQALAQEITANFLPIHEGAWRGFVSGTLLSAADVDTYSFPLQRGEQVRILVENPQQRTVKFPFGAPPALLENLTSEQLAKIAARLEDPSNGAAFAGTGDFRVVLQPSKGSVVTGKRLPGVNVDAATLYTASASGMYSLTLRGGETFTYPTEYRVLILRNAQFEQERNDTIFGAQPVLLGQPVLGFLGETTNGTLENSALPRSVSGGKITLWVNGDGGFGINNEHAIEVDGLEYLSIFWPHQPILTAPTSGGSSPLRLTSAVLSNHYTGNRQEMHISGEFAYTDPGGVLQRIRFGRAITWYNAEMVVSVRTTLSNQGDTSAKSLTLTDDFFPISPGGPDPATLSMLANGRLAAATGNGHTFGVGSPDTNLTVKIVPRTPEQTDSRPGMVSAALPVGELPAKSSVVSEFYMVFGDTPNNTAALYESAVRTGFNADDYYRVTLQKGRMYHFQALLATQDSTFSVPGIGIGIFDGQGKLLASEPPEPENISSTIRFQAPESGNYYVRVYNETVDLMNGNDYVFTVEDKTTIIHFPLVNRP
jgi:hypothetical protein